MSNTYWVLFFILFFVDMLFAAMRTSLILARPVGLVPLHDRYPKAVDDTLKLMDRPNLPTMLRASLTTTHLLLAGSLYLLATLYFTPAQLSIGVVLIGSLVFVVLILFFEFAVEGLVLPNTEMWAIRLTGLARAVDLLFRPLTWLLMRLVGSPDSLVRSRFGVTEDELKSWVEVGQQEGSLEQGERKMIYSIFQFGDTLCREIMVPRIDVVALDVNTSVEDAVDLAVQSGHSRLPVYEEAIDNVIGVLYAKDLLRLKLDVENGNSVRGLLRTAYFVPEAKKVDELLREMQARGVHMSIVVDEYGGMAGIVTLEDIVEEIVGEIRDEYDQSEELLYQQISPDEYQFLGRIDLDDFNEILDTHLTKEIADTLGGYIYGQIGRVPVGGEKLEVEDWQIEVEQVSGRRIRMVRARRRSQFGETQETEHESER